MLKPYEDTFPDLLEGLTPRDLKVVMDWTTGKFSSMAKLSAEYGMSPVTISKLLSRPNVEKYIGVVRQMQYQEVAMNQMNATKTIVDIMLDDQAQDRDRLKAANLITTMAGTDKPERDSDSHQLSVDMGSLVKNIVKEAEARSSSQINIQVNVGEAHSSTTSGPQALPPHDQDPSRDSEP